MWNPFPCSQHFFLSFFGVSRAQVTSSLPAFMEERKRSQESLLNFVINKSKQICAEKEMPDPMKNYSEEENF